MSEYHYTLTVFIIVRSNCSKNDITERGKLILDYQLNGSHSYGRKTEIYKLDEQNCFELVNCLTDHYGYSVEEHEYGMNDVDISEDEYNMQIVEVFEGYYEADGYSSSIPLLLAMKREFPDADHFEGRAFGMIMIVWMPPKRIFS